jgi:glycine/D-amino acid oxidase-like deaminating enzyme
MGGGIIGTATAFYASRAELKTLVLEERDGLTTLTTTSSLRAFSFSAYKVPGTCSDYTKASQMTSPYWWVIISIRGSGFDQGDSF